MNLEFAHIQENAARLDALKAYAEAHMQSLAQVRAQIDDCVARTAEAKTWQSVIDGCLTSGAEIRPQRPTSPSTPRGLLRCATDGERANGRLAWVPGALS